MDKNDGPLSWLKNLFNNNGKTYKKTNKLRYQVLVLCISAVFMLMWNILFNSNPLVPAISTVKSQQLNSNAVSTFGLNNNSGSSPISYYEQQYENELKSALEAMLGVEDVTVLVNLASPQQMNNLLSQTMEIIKFLLL